MLFKINNEGKASNEIKNNNRFIRWIKRVLQNRDECISESEVYIRLNGGLRSSKYIQYYEDGSWWIEHQSCDAECEYKNDKEFKENEPMIFKALNNGALIKYREEGK